MSESLKKRIGRGEPTAFVELHEQLGDSLMRYLTSRLGRTDAADVMQEVFVRMVRFRKKVAKCKNLEAYIFLIARNEANRWLKKNSKLVHSAGELETIAASNNNFRSVETNELIHELLNQVPLDVSEIIRLKVYSNLTFKDIGELLNQNESTVATKYRRAIQKLQSKYAQWDQRTPKELSSHE